LESRQCNIRGLPVTPGDSTTPVVNREENQEKPIRNQEKAKQRF
jgi:hypothetical protein